MYAISCDSVRRRKLPAGKDRLHDLKPEPYPVDAGRQGGVIHLDRGRGPQTENNLRFNTRLGERLERQSFDSRKIVCSAVENIAPDRSVHPILRPDRAIGETNLAAKHL